VNTCLDRNPPAPLTAHLLRPKHNAIHFNSFLEFQFSITTASAVNLKPSPNHSCILSVTDNIMARTPATPQALAKSQAAPKVRSTRRRTEKMRAPSPVLDIPYFAHMQLNPARYSTGKLSRPLPFFMKQASCGEPLISSILLFTSHSL
jgi:hypothetical protein